MTKKLALSVAAIVFISVPAILNTSSETVPPVNNMPPVKTAIVADSKNVSQNNWYSSAAETITKAEYEFKKDTAGKRYSTPNRKNNLRFFYDENGFTAQPRTTKIAVENNNTGKSPDDIQYRKTPNWKVAFNLDKKQTGKGKWLVDANTAEYITNKVTVQYINNEEGMRQNFIVASPLSNDNVLKINFSINTTLKIKLQQQELQFFHKKAGNVLNYSQLKVWDADNKLLAAKFEKNGNDYCIRVNARDAVYPITIDPISTTPSGIMESNQANAQMGVSVSSAGDVNGDGYSDVIVGAHLYDNGQTDEGRAYIYHGSDTGTSGTAAAILESNQASAQFGITVSTAGDVNGDGFSDVLVGANLYDNGQTDEGAVFVYHGSATGVNTTAVIRLESNVATSNFGIAVACAGDVNGDGFSDIVTGSNLFSFGQTNEGVAIVYRGSATGIVSNTAAILQINQAGANMGTSVASAGDINGDGFSDIIIGVPLYNGGLAGEGAAVIYTGSATGINTTVAATLESNQLNANMGQSVSTAGDVNGDGYSDVIVGANLYDKGQTDEGVAFVYHGAAGGIITLAVDTLEINQVSANFGRSVACAGDINGDGYSDIIVGANLYENGQTNEGAVFVYQGSVTGINNTAIAVLESNQANANMGQAVSSAGDVNGDGFSDVIAGANLFDNGETDEGRAYIYHGAANGINLLYTVSDESDQASAFMGYSVASAGDINKDGYGDVIVGAYDYDNGVQNEGRAYIYKGSPAGLDSVAATILESNSLNAEFGFSVASAGDVNGDGYSDIIVGAWNYGGGGTGGAGAAFVYHGSATGIDTTADEILTRNQFLLTMGCSVASAGDVNGDGYSDVIVGADRYTNGQTREGAAFIYYGSDTGVSSIGAAILEVNQASANFGNSVSSAGDINGDGYSDVIVGADYFDNGQTDEGAAFIYYGSSSGINLTPADTLEKNQAGSYMGWSVASAGDVNGDGYGDVITGVFGYSNGNPNEGAVFVYLGSATGINPISTFYAEGNQSNSGMGCSVASAGDVNGDGYGDIVFGANDYSLGQQREGVAFVFYGSPAGITAAGAGSLQINQSFSQFGYSVASAGDVNGDGYSDVITGAYGYTNIEGAEGAIFLFYGNNGGLRSNLKLYNSDLVTPLQQSNSTDPLFGTGLYAKSPLGRQKGKLVVQTVKNGFPFPGNPITNSTSFTAQDATYTNLGLTGNELKRQVNKLQPTKTTSIRARIKYDPATAITGQVYAPWHYGEVSLRSATTYNWTGNVSVIWENPANWSSNAVPVSTSVVVIPAGRPRYPTINATTSIKSLSLAPGTSTITATGVTLNIIGH